jgi:aspartate/methionine/tyrosine aminotransferase
MDRTDSQLLLAGRLAERIDRLGDESAFTSAAEAAEVAATGREIYPFHIGNVDLPTPGNIVDAMNKAIRDGKTGYCPTEGIAELRQAIAKDVGHARDVAYDATDVAVQPGGKSVIGKFLLTFMNQGDEVLYPSPGFPIYSSLIGCLGGGGLPYPYHETQSGFAIDLDFLEHAITPRTRLLLLNDLHNPTGAECSSEELERIASIVERHDLLVLCDEAYFDVRVDGGRSHSLVTLPGMQDRCVILYTFSKKFAMGGWRLGAAIGPSPVIDVIGKLNTNLESCTNHFVQWAGVEALSGSQAGPQDILAVLRERRDTAHGILVTIPGITCHKAETTFYLYPNITGAMDALGVDGDEEFRRLILRETGVSFCTRSQFGAPLPGETQQYIRLAYSGIDSGRIEEGLLRLKAFIENA